MPDMDGLDALEQIRENTPTTKVIMISAHDNPSYVARAVVLGAVDFLLKDVPGEAYVAAIHRAVAGGELAADTLFSQIRKRGQPAFEGCAAKAGVVATWVEARRQMGERGPSLGGGPRYCPLLDHTVQKESRPSAPAARDSP